MGAGRTVGIDTDHGVGESVLAVTMDGIDDQSRRDAPAAVGGQGSQLVDPDLAAFVDLVIGWIAVGEEEADDLAGRRVTCDRRQVGSAAESVDRFAPAFGRVRGRTPVILERRVLDGENLLGVLGLRIDGNSGRVRTIGQGGETFRTRDVTDQIVEPTNVDESEPLVEPCRRFVVDSA